MQQSSNPFLSVMKRNKYGNFINSVDPKVSFWTHVNKTSSCWLWTGATNSVNYGMFYVRKRRVLAHRYSLEINGKKLTSKDVVAHKCDNSLCVNPDHLFIGTQADNLADMRKKGRGSFDGLKYGRGKRGETNANHKLTSEQVIEIRKSTEKVGKLAKKLGVSHSVVSNIRNGKTWKHVN